MNCREFESAWNERLDARGAAPVDPGPALDGHAAACPSCRALGARYLALAQAIGTPAPPLAPPAGFADRVLAAAAERPAAAVIPPRTRLVRLAAAAAVVAAVGLSIRAWTAGRVGPEVRTPPAPVARVQPDDADDLAEALAAATSASWDLAREASAPAARVGRRVLGAAELSDGSSPFALPEPGPPVAEVLQAVGDRVNAGVGPLGGSARRAFGFLLGPADDSPPPPANAPKRGA